MVKWSNFEKRGSGFSFVNNHKGYLVMRPNTWALAPRWLEFKS